MSLNSLVIICCIALLGNGVDFISAPINVTFAAGTTSTTVNIPVISDDIAEGSETFNLQIIIPGRVQSSFPGTTTEAVVTITDNSSKY